jgi:hypothetical protein
MKAGKFLAEKQIDNTVCIHLHEAISWQAKLLQQSLAKIFIEMRKTDLNKLTQAGTNAFYFLPGWGGSCRG